MAHSHRKGKSEKKRKRARVGSFAGRCLWRVTADWVCEQVHRTWCREAVIHSVGTAAAREPQAGWPVVQLRLVVPNAAPPAEEVTPVLW